MDVEDVFSSKTRMKILKVIAKLGSLNISEIARQVKINYASANENLTLLEAEGILRKHVYGRIRMYRFNESSPKAKAVQNLLEVWEQSTSGNLS
jgi:DNA-binding transcriptional ArsR family regulator